MGRSRSRIHRVVQVGARLQCSTRADSCQAAAAAAAPARAINSTAETQRTMKRSIGGGTCSRLHCRALFASSSVRDPLVVGFSRCTHCVVNDETSHAQLILTVDRARRSAGGILRRFRSSDVSSRSSFCGLQECR